MFLSQCIFWRFFFYSTNQDASLNWSLSMKCPLYAYMFNPRIHSWWHCLERYVEYLGYRAWLKIVSHCGGLWGFIAWLSFPVHSVCWLFMPCDPPVSCFYHWVFLVRMENILLSYDKNKLFNNLFTCRYFMTAMKKKMSTFLESGALQPHWLISWEPLSPLAADNSGVGEIP